MNTNGWERLLCDYFSATCVSELSEPFAMDGFRVARIESAGAVVFKQSDVFIEIGYEAESAPSYSPTVVVGFGDRKFDEAGRPAAVPLWFLIHDDEPSRQYSFWRFSSTQQLREVLRRIKSEVLDRHVLPLSQHTEFIEKALSRFRAALA